MEAASLTASTSCKAVGNEMGGFALAHGLGISQHLPAQAGRGYSRLFEITQLPQALLQNQQL